VFTYISPSIEKHMGYEAHEVLGRSLWDFITPDSIEPLKRRVAQRINLLLSDREVYEPETYELEQKRKDGTTMWTEATAIPVFNNEGQFIGFQGVTRDITERKQADEALRESEERFHQIAEIAADWIWEVDEKGLFVYSSSASKRILGYSSDELVGRKYYYDFFPPELKDDLKEKAFAIFESKESFRGFVNPNVRKDGEIVILETSGSPLIDNEGILVGYRGADKDVTNRFRAEEAQLRMTAAIEQTPDGIVIMDPQGTIEYVNSGFEHITGYRKEEVIGRKHHLFQEDEHDEALCLAVQEKIIKGENWLGRLTRNRKDGSSYVEEIALSPVLDRVGKIINIVAVKRDVSKEISLQQQLLQAQKMEAVGTLTGGIAHDFNNLLQVVLGYSEFLLSRKQETDPEYDELRKIYQAGKRGSDLVQNLMMFSRKVQPNFRLIDLNDEVVQIEKLLSRTIPKTINIRTHLSGELEFVEADISQIGQVLVNLAVNARDAMPDGGTLNIETMNFELDEDYCATHLEVKPGRYALLTVSDSGHGMDKETISRIFEPFFSTKEAGKGTGLGLATVFGIVKQHKGHIMCSSELGHGTTFKIYFPAIEKTGDSETQTLEMPIQGGTETILIVDDEEHLRNLVTTILKHHGYQVVTASNGKEALETYNREHEKIALVILDLIMPEMDGKKCLAEILNINLKAKVLIATGHSEGGIILENSLPGARGLVAKPYEIRKLLQSVREVLDAEGKGEPA